MRKLISVALLLPIAVLSGCTPPGDEYYNELDGGSSVTSISSEVTGDTSSDVSSEVTESESESITESDTSLMWEPAASRLSGGDESWVAESDYISTVDRPETGASVSQTSVVDISLQFTILNDNIPVFSEQDILRSDPFVDFSELDSAGRCGTAFANVSVDLIPSDSDSAPVNIDPTGWHSYFFDNIIEDGSLYYRCRLISFCGVGDGDDERNLITGTQFFNEEGMYPYELIIKNYVEETGNHVLYRVTPVFSGSNLLADGVQMEGWSVEDNGEGVCFNVFIPNIQPGVEIDYVTGEAWRE